MAPSTSAKDNGIVNAKDGITMMTVAPLLYLGCATFANWVTKPGGMFEALLNGVLNTTTFVATAGTQSTLPVGKTIPALALLYTAATYSISSASSASAIASAYKEGRNNKYPRSQTSQLTGFPLRVHSAHQHLMEIFPAFALIAGLVATMAPKDQQLINLLGLHVLVKLGVFWPSYLADLDGPRGLGHLLSIGALVAAGYKLTLG